MSKQITDTILMVRPANFGYNAQTAESNAFQTKETSLSVNEIKAKAIAEFDGFVKKLRAAGINVIVAQDSDTPIKTDAVFPNNWVSFHENGTYILYPMQATSRRTERQQYVLDEVFKHHSYPKKINFAEFEIANRYLEGTGSMILDRQFRKVYACLSPRTDSKLLDRFCKWANYEKVVFSSKDENDTDIYHTNVMMAIGETFAVICLDSIKDEAERKMVQKALISSHKEIIEISFDQMNRFAGNMLQVDSASGDAYLVMSEQAFNSLTDEQVDKIESHTQILYSPIETIEKFGGGSARCMMAEVFY